MLLGIDSAAQSEPQRESVRIVHRMGTWGTGYPTLGPLHSFGRLNPLFFPFTYFI